MTASALRDVLGADGPAADRAGKMDLYGRFVGSWDLDVTQIADDGSRRQRPGEWHFGWALEGRAIQDVWIVPPRGQLRHGDAAANVNSYGTTLRIYDPAIDAWRIQWSDPVTQNFLQMIGREQGDDIVQLGTRPDGKPVRWSFSEITPTSFRWRGEISDDDGVNWRLNVECATYRLAVRCGPSLTSLRGAKRRSNPASVPAMKDGLLRGACHRAALRADPLAPNDG